MFPTAAQLYSWAGICPGNNRSAGKSRTTHIKNANKFLLLALVEASWGAARTGGTRYQAQFAGWSRNLGRKKAIIAVCHSLLRTIHAMLRDQQPYQEPDPVTAAAREREKRIRHHAKRLRDLGMNGQACNQLIEQLTAAAARGILPRRAGISGTTDPSSTEKNICKSQRSLSSLPLIAIKNDTNSDPQSGGFYFREQALSAPSQTKQ